MRKAASLPGRPVWEEGGPAGAGRRICSPGSRQHASAVVTGAGVGPLTLSLRAHPGAPQVQSRLQALQYCAHCCCPAGCSWTMSATLRRQVRAGSLALGGRPSRCPGSRCGGIGRARTLSRTQPWGAEQAVPSSGRMCSTRGSKLPSGQESRRKRTRELPDRAHRV